MKAGNFLDENCGSIYYASPEIISGLQYSGEEIDTWSCGVCLYAILVGEFPFDSSSNRRLAKKIVKGEFDVPCDLSAEVDDLLLRQLHPNPLKRINLECALKHPWFSQGSFEKFWGRWELGESIIKSIFEETWKQLGEKYQNKREDIFKYVCQQKRKLEIEKEKQDDIMAFI